MQFARLIAILALALALITPAAAQPAPQTMLMTVFLRHDQSKTVDEINAHLDKTGFRKNFPPEGVEIVSYNIVMGIGHVICFPEAGSRIGKYLRTDVFGKIQGVP